MPGAEGLGPVLPGIVEGQALLQVGAGRHEFAEPIADLSQGPVGLEEQRRIMGALRQGQEVLGQLAGGPEIPAVIIIQVQTVGYREALGRVPHLLAQGVRPGIGPFDFRGGPPLGGE
jgi:hypothetical protein